MPFDKTLPTWGNAGAAPPAFKQAEGWQADEHPPASIFNWFFHTVYQALDELQKEALNADQKGINNGLATLDGAGDLPIGQADNILNWVKGFGLGGVSKALTAANDLNTLADTAGFFYATASPNRPGSENGWLIHQPMNATYAAQVYIGISGKLYNRSKNNGVWTAWAEQETTTGAQTKATAAANSAGTTAETNAKNASMPRNDTRVNSADLNTYVTTGITAIGSPVTNGPAGAAFGNLMVFNSAGDRITQLFTNAGNSTVYIRHATGSAPRVWTAWEALETATGAQAKATAAAGNAETNAINFAKNNGLGQNLSARTMADYDTAKTTGFYYGGSSALAKPPGTDHAVLVMAFSTIWVTQVAFDWRTEKQYIRSCENGAWTPWVEQETATGAQEKVDAHANLKTNPHGVTKAQIGLPNTPDYAPATKAEAEAGTATNKVMTPERTKEAILKLAPPPTAATVTIADAGNYYAGVNAETALQEIGQALNGSRGSLIDATNQLLLL